MVDDLPDDVAPERLVAKKIFSGTATAVECLSWLKTVAEHRHSKIGIMACNKISESITPKTQHFAIVDSDGDIQDGTVTRHPDDSWIFYCYPEDKKYWESVGNRCIPVSIVTAPTPPT